MFLRSKIPIKVIEINYREKHCDEQKNIRYQNGEWSMVNGGILWRDKRT